MKRILLGSAWLASVAGAYFIGHTVPSHSLTTQPPKKDTATSAANSDSTERVGHASAFSDSPEQAPGAAKDIPKLIRRVRVEMGSGFNGMTNLRGLLHALAPLAELTDAEVQEALAQVESSVPEQGNKMMFYSILLSQWAENDGPAALAYADKVGGNGPFNAGPKLAVIGTWAKRDPDAVWRWYQNNKPDDDTSFTGRMMLGSIFNGMASRDLTVAFARMNTLPEEERSQALGGIANSAKDDQARRELLDRADSLSTEQRRQLQDNVARGWAMSDPDATMKWIRSQSAEDQTELRKSVGPTIMMSDPERGAAFQLETATDKDRGDVVNSIVGSWAWRDARRAGDWLSKQPQGPELDQARGTYAKAVSQRDPSAAMDWAKSITSDEQRTASVGDVYNAWKKKDTTAADAALNSSGLTAEQIQKLRGTEK